MAYPLLLRPAASTVAMNTMSAALPNATVGHGSLVFDFEVEERSNPCDVVPQARSKEQLIQAKEKLIHFSLPETMYASKLLRDVRYFVNEERDPDAILLATKLSAVGYNVNVRTAIGGGTACFRNLRHEFLTVRGKGDAAGPELIVEPRFREHFLIPHPTEEFSELLGHAPDVFVGVGGRLVPIVQTLCEAMADSFERKGLTLPPWRRTQAMLSKWLPNRARDMAFCRASAPPVRDSDPPTLTAATSGQMPVADAVVAAGCTDSAALFLRISDPLFVPGYPNAVQALLHQQQQQLQQQQVLQQPCCVDSSSRGSSGGAHQQQQQLGPERRDEWALLAQGFIPFGGAGGCSSDTEGPSPPAAGAVDAAPAAGGPMGHTHRRDLATAAAGIGGTAAIAGTAVEAAAARRSGVHGGLLASHLQQPAAPAAAAVALPGGARPHPPHHPQPHHPHPHQQHQQARILETRPPAHWGEAPIHRIRMGFMVAAPAASADQRPLKQGQGQTPDLVPERPAPPQP